MNKIGILFGMLLAVVTAQAATVGNVVIEQQWPWSTDIRVKYDLSGVTEPVNVTVKMYDGATEISADSVKAATKGGMYGLAADGTHVIEVDPKVLFGANRVAVGDFRVELALAAAPANINEVIYKIYDLEKGTCKDVKRSDFFNKSYGSYVTNFTQIGSDYASAVQDVLIWTDVTNDVQYATTKLVMRKVPASAAGAWTMGANGQAEAPAHQVTFTKDYWMGVFEVTQAQYATIVSNNFGGSVTTAWPSFFTEATSRATRPVEQIGYNMLRGLVAQSNWPENNVVESWSFLALLRAKFGGNVTFDLPTEAQWEFACHAGTTTQLYTGWDLLTPTWDGDERLSLIARSRRSGGWINGVTAPVATTPANEGGTGRVGSYRPNAYGLYDMQGNVYEWCLDWYELYTADAVTDPTGPMRNNNNWSRVVRSGSWNDKCFPCRTTMRVGSTYGSMASTYGFRLCVTE